MSYGNIFGDDLESGGTTNWTGSTGATPPVADATSKKNGSYGLDATASPDYLNLTVPVWSGALYFRVYVKTVSLALAATYSGNRFITLLRSGAAYSPYWEFRSNGTTAVDAVTAGGWNPKTWTQNAWHRLEFCLDSVAKTLVIQLDGTTTDTLDASGWGTLTNYRDFRIGLAVDSQTSYGSGSVYFDDVSFDTRGWIGDTLAEASTFIPTRSGGAGIGSGISTAII